MALANLNINVNANITPVVNAMVDVKAATAVNMGKAGESVKSFQADFAKSAAVVKSEAGSVSSGMEDVKDSAAAAVAPVKELSKGVEVVSQKMKDAFGPEAAAQVKNTTDRVEEFVGTRVAIAAAGLAFGAVAGTIVAVGFAAYKASGFVAGLFTGESYKSGSIDALIAMNKEVVDLQKNLQMSAVDANALRDALSRLGVSKSDVVTVYEKTEDAIRTNGEELDRLGVKYKAVDGTLLDTAKIVQNAKAELDKYTEGWDRNKAAAAMGMGSYDQINNYLKVNQEEVRKSKLRLDEYNLGIGTESQAAVAAYSAAMLEFKNETTLMSEGFKRAWADQIMPAFTRVSESLKDGWPVIVNVFRYATAQITSLLYGLETSFYLAGKTIITAMTGIVDILEGVVLASGALISGDFTGAKDALVKGWNNAKATINQAGDDIVAHTTKNAAAMKLAWGFDDRSAGGGMVPGSGKAGGKPFQGKPAATGGTDTTTQMQVDAEYLKYEKAFYEQEAAMAKASSAEKTEISKQEYETGLTTLAAYLDQKHSMNQAALQADLAAKQSELKAAREFEKTAEAAYTADPSNASEKTVYEAYAKTAIAIKAVTEAQSKLTVAKMTDADESRKMIKDQIDGYTSTGIALLTMAGKYEEAAIAKEKLERSSTAFVQMQKEAASGNAAAIEAVAAKEKQWMIDRISGAEQVSAEQAKWAIQITDANIEMMKSIGLDTKLLEAQKEKQTAAATLVSLQLQLNRAKDGETAAIQAQIELQKKKIAQNRQEVLERQGVLNGTITGFNENGAVFRDAYAQEQAATRYISNAELLNGAPKSSGGLDYWGDPIRNGYGFRANGGPVEAGSPYIVGERGPELLIPRSAGTVVPNGQFGQSITMNGGVSVVLPNVTRADDYDAIARGVLARIKLLGGRSL